MDITPSKVRQELGNPSSEDLTEQAIEDAILEEKSFWGAVARCAEILARRYAHQSDYALMEYRESFSQRAKAWASLAVELRSKARNYSTTTGPYAGGLSVAEKDRVFRDPNRVKPSFSRNMMEVDVDGF